MKIGIIGAGAIGTTLARRLAESGHEVAIANSRAPETIPAAALETGARAVWARDAADGAEALIVSVNFGQIPSVAETVRAAPQETVVIDTSNYYPGRDGDIDGIGQGQVESEWVAEQLGRPIIKAWNAILADSFIDKRSEPGAADRVAIPVAGDDEAARRVALDLVEDTGFTGVDAGSISESWRQQPGAPAYCTDLDEAALIVALEAADRSRSHLRRDLVWSTITERSEAGGPVTAGYVVALNRAVY